MNVPTSLAEQRSELSQLLEPRLPLRRKAAKMFRAKTSDLLNRYFFQLAKQLGTHTLLECGAHEALTSARFVKHVGKRAIAIEANPNVYTNRTKKAENFGVTALNVGLGNIPSELEFYAPTDKQLPGNSSFLKKPGKEYKTHKVPVTTIDQLVDDHQITEPFGLWVDVEGYAFQVMTGGKQSVKPPQCQLIKIELEDKTFWEHQRTSLAVDQLLTSMGFKLFICDIEFKHQFNALYVAENYFDHVNSIQQTAWNELKQIELSWREWLFPQIKTMRDIDLSEYLANDI